MATLSRTAFAMQFSPVVIGRYHFPTPKYKYEGSLRIWFRSNVSTVTKTIEIDIGTGDVQLNVFLPSDHTGFILAQFGFIPNSSLAR